MSKSGRLLVSLVIEDDGAQGVLGAVEVRVKMVTGADRWCFFMTPEALAACGDLLPDSSVRFHLGVAHMIVVSEIDEDIIRRTLEEIDSQGALLAHTVPIT